jgi:hypothetical protein
MRGGIVLGMILSAAQPAHVSNTFHLTVGAPMSRAAVLFGPDGERCWAGTHWNPQFVYPQPSKDVQGAVFTVQHGPHRVVWVNTVFDLAGGRMRYAALIPDKLVFTVDVRLTAIDPSRTSVEVTYVRTALEVTANDEVEAMGKMDQQNGPEWQEAIEKCLNKPG